MHEKFIWQGKKAFWISGEHIFFLLNGFRQHPLRADSDTEHTYQSISGVRVYFAFGKEFKKRLVDLWRISREHVTIARCNKSEETLNFKIQLSHFRISFPDEPEHNLQRF